MAAKQSTISKAAVVLFTSIVAPVVVNLTVTQMKTDDEKPNHHEAASESQESPPAQLARPQAAVIPAKECPQRVETTQIIVRGTGRSTEEALRVALGLALQQAVASQVDAEAWARNGHAILADVAQDRRLILGWKDLGTDKEWKIQGTVYRKDVAVDVDRTALKERLRAAGNPTRAGDPLIWRPTR